MNRNNTMFRKCHKPAHFGSYDEQLKRSSKSKKKFDKEWDTTGHIISWYEKSGDKILNGRGHFRPDGKMQSCGTREITDTSSDYFKNECFYGKVDTDGFFKGCTWEGYSFTNDCESL